MALTFVTSCEIELTQEELTTIAELSKMIGKDFPTTLRMCMNERATELLALMKDMDKEYVTIDTNTGPDVPLEDNLIKTN